jgi:hypothetical protein
MEAAGPSSRRLCSEDSKINTPSPASYYSLIIIVIIIIIIIMVLFLLLALFIAGRLTSLLIAQIM